MKLSTTLIFILAKGELIYWATSLMIWLRHAYNCGLLWWDGLIEITGIGWGKLRDLWRSIAR